MSYNEAKFLFNEEFNGIEIYFDEKPEEEILDELHAERWRWHKKKRCWYNYDSDEHRETAEKVCMMHNGYDEPVRYSNNEYTDFSYEAFDDYDFDPSEWDEESIIRKHGYTVSQEEGLSAAERQRILSMVIKNRVMTPYQVINHIERMINLRDRQSKYNLACQKWREDMQFVRRVFC